MRGNPSRWPAAPVWQFQWDLFPRANLSAHMNVHAGGPLRQGLVHRGPGQDGRAGLEARDAVGATRRAAAPRCGVSRPRAGPTGSESSGGGGGSWGNKASRKARAGGGAHGAGSRRGVKGLKHIWLCRALRDVPKGRGERGQARTAVGQLCRPPAPEAVGAHAGRRGAGLGQHLLGPAPELTRLGDRREVRDREVAEVRGPSGHGRGLSAIGWEGGASRAATGRKTDSGRAASRAGPARVTATRACAPGARSRGPLPAGGIWADRPSRSGSVVGPKTPISTAPG